MNLPLTRVEVSHDNKVSRPLHFPGNKIWNPTCSCVSEAGHGHRRTPAVIATSHLQSDPIRIFAGFQSRADDAQVSSIKSVAHPEEPIDHASSREAPQLITGVYRAYQRTK